MSMTKKRPGRTNVFLTVLLFLGCITILFPLYMAVMIAFKSPTEMTNDIDRKSVV